MWQMCSYVPQSLLSGALSEDKLAELTASFFLETFVHAKEKVRTQKLLFKAPDIHLRFAFSQCWCSGLTF
jgi:hypothetical protein